MKSIGSIKLENQSTDQSNQSGLLTDNDFKIVDTSENSRKFLKQCKICHFTTYIEETKQICRNCHEIKGSILGFGKPKKIEKPQNVIYERQKMAAAKPEANVKEEEFNCSICKLNFGTSKQLSAHIDKNHEDHKCKICNKIFVAKEFKIKHDSIAHNVEQASNKPYQCKYCEKKFEFEFTLKKHFELVHTRTFNGGQGMKRFHCYMCNISFNFKLHLKKHLAEIHELKESRFTCELCGFEPKKNQNTKMKLNQKYDHLLFYHFKQAIAELNKDLKVENGNCPFQNCQFKTEENNKDGEKSRQHWTILRHYTCQHGILRKLLTEALTKIHSSNVILPSKKIRDESRAFVGVYPKGSGEIALDESRSQIEAKSKKNIVNVRDNVVVCDINEIINKKIDKPQIQPIKNEVTTNQFHENFRENDFTKNDFTKNDIPKDDFVEDNGHLDLDYIAGDAANNVDLFSDPDEKFVEIKNHPSEDFENITILTVGDDIMEDSNELPFLNNIQNTNVKSENFESASSDNLIQDFVQGIDENFDPLDVDQDDKAVNHNQIKTENNFGNDDEIEDFECLNPENKIATNSEKKSEKRKINSSEETSRKISKIDNILKQQIGSTEKVNYPKNEKILSECIKCDFCSQYSLALNQVSNRNEGEKELKKHIEKVHGILALKKFLSNKKVDSGENITAGDIEKTPKEISKQASSEDFKSSCSICGFKPVTNKKNTYNNILRFHMMKTHLRNR